MLELVVGLVDSQQPLVYIEQRAVVGHTAAVEHSQPAVVVARTLVLAAAFPVVLERRFVLGTWAVAALRLVVDKVNRLRLVVELADHHLALVSSHSP